MREYLSKHEFGQAKGFRWRNAGEISRIEGFSDAVFGFAVTLLVVSLEVPKTYDELVAGMHGFLAFAAGFAVLFMIWMQQYKFFRQYGLQDGPTLWLNAGLLFVVLFFTYPLKFLYSLSSDLLTHRASIVKVGTTEVKPIVGEGQMHGLLMIYGFGYLAVFGMLFFLHLRAWCRRDELELSPLERWMTRETMQEQASQMLIAIISITFAAFGSATYAGLTYCLIAPFITINSTIMGRKQRKMFGD